MENPKGPGWTQAIFADRDVEQRAAPELMECYQAEFVRTVNRVLSQTSCMGIAMVKLGRHF
jgi:hypothetical protein